MTRRTDVSEPADQQLVAEITNLMDKGTSPYPWTNDRGVIRDHDGTLVADGGPHAGGGEVLKMTDLRLASLAPEMADLVVRLVGQVHVLEAEKAGIAAKLKESERKLESAKFRAGEEKRKTTEAKAEVKEAEAEETKH